MPPEVAAVFSLSKAEKLQLVEDLWDDIAANPDDVPVHDWQKEELDKRKANLAENPGAALTWEEIVRRVRARHGG
jgi:putative addiction module component (TIGR02574 family)